MSRSAMFLFRVLAAALLPSLAAAGEPPWEGEHDPHRRHMENLADLEARGKIGPEQARELDRYWATHLRRGRLDALVSAHYAIAEIHLRRGNPQQAVAQLNKVLATARDEDVKSLTHLNLAELHRRALGDAVKAIPHYQQVAGALRHRAQAYLVALLAATGKAEQAAKATEDLIAAAADKGEKLTLLQRLAAVYEKAKMPDKALAVYTRITTELTPDDLDAIREAAAAQAQGFVRKMAEFRQQHDFEGVERTERQLRRRADSLRMAGRWDEFRAFERAARTLMQQLMRPPQPGEPGQPRRPQPEPPPRRDGEF